MGSVIPLHYRIHLVPDLDTFVFKGFMTLDAETKSPISTVVLNALELNIKEIRLGDTSLEFSLDMELQTLTVELNQEVSGVFKLEIDYTGEINDKLAGLYRSRYQVDGEDRFVAVTQFQESDARRAFPCFDSPEWKATFDISYTVPEEFKTISNTSIVKEESLDNGLKHVVFEQTPKMSTYLVFFAFGEFEWITDTYRTIPIRVVTSPGKAENYGDLAMDYGKKSLQYCEEYFDIDYPLSKMDLIATPDFAAGAMENWGAILFRENALLYYPGVTTQGGKTSIKNVIAHEIAHQWFGNLVSPDKWKYVWLNESFATYFAFKTIDHYEPDYGIFDYFIQGTTNGALTSDGRHQTVAIEQVGDEPAAYTVKTVPILYNKGGSVLRQLEGFLGAKGFQEGLRHYLKKHEYNVAGSNDLWVAFEEVSGEPISKMMEGWVMQEGYPILEVIREGTNLHLSQRRYTYLNRSYETRWMVPVTLRQYLSSGEVKDDAFLMEDEQMNYLLQEDCLAFKVNTEHTGFYRVLYTPDHYDLLAPKIKDKSLTAIDRFNIENDLYAFMQSGQVSLDTYLSYLENYRNEDNHLPLGSISNHLNSLYNLLDGDVQDKVAKTGINFYRSLLDHIGYEPREDESHTITIMRASVIYRSSKFGSERSTKFAMNKFKEVKAGKQVDPNIINAVLQVAARETNDWDFFTMKLKEAESEAEKQYYLIAMYNFTTPELIEKLQMHVFEEVPSRNRGTAIGVLCQNKEARDSLWEWYLANLDNFENLHPFMYQQAMTTLIVACVDNRDEITEFFANYIKKNPQVKDPVDVALEILDINASIKSRYE